MKDLRMMREAMRLFRQLSPQLRASQVELLATVATRPGLSQTELGIECDLTVAAVSRAVDVMGSSGRKDGLSGALGLLTVRRDEDDDRIKRVYLTSEGQAFMAAIGQALEPIR